MRDGFVWFRGVSNLMGVDDDELTQNLPIFDDAEHSALASTVLPVQPWQDMRRQDWSL